MSTDVRVAVVTVSGRAATGEREDVTGPALAGAVRSTGLDMGEQRVAPDDRAVLAGLIHELAGTHDLVLLAGGVGIGPHDLTPDAVEACCERMIPGVGEVVRAASRDDIPGASLWRACAGTRGAAVVDEVYRAMGEEYGGGGGHAGIPGCRGGRLGGHVVVHRAGRGAGARRGRGAVGPR